MTEDRVVFVLRAVIFMGLGAFIYALVDFSEFWDAMVPIAVLFGLVLAFWIGSRFGMVVFK